MNKEHKYKAKDEYKDNAKDGHIVDWNLSLHS